MSLDSIRRIALIARNTFREAIRQRLINVIVLVALVLVVAARWLRDFNFGAPELKFLGDCGFGALSLFGGALAVVATVQLFFSELENQTALTLLAKPVRRTEFLLGKFAGVLMLLGLFCSLLTLVLAGVLWSREVELRREYGESFPSDGVVSYTAVAIAGLLQWLKLAVLAAFVTLISSFARTPLFTLVAGFLILVLGHLQHFAAGVYERGAGMGASVGKLVTAALPNFQLFTVADSISHSEILSANALFRLGAYGLGYVAVATVLAAYCFHRREL